MTGRVLFTGPSIKRTKRRYPCLAALRVTLHVAQPADEAAPHAAIRRFQPHSGAHNLAIAPRLASVGALSDNMMLAASTGCHGRSTRKLAPLSAGLKQVCALFPVRPVDARRGTKGQQKPNVLKSKSGRFQRLSGTYPAGRWAVPFTQVSPVA